MTWDLYGHEWAVSMLKQHIIHRQTRHAYLFVGPPGVGKRSLALCFARAINCQNPPSLGEYCGVCRVCRQMETMQHIDLAVVSAEKPGGTLKVEQIRELQQRLFLTPYEAEFRIALLLRFQEANQNAQNALLKTLEEAPRKVILLLTADTPESLLPTIVSRCEMLRLRPVRIEELIEYLQVRKNIPQKEAVCLAHLAGGRVGFALQLYDNPDQLEQHQIWIRDLLNLLQSSVEERFKYADQSSKNRETMRNQLFVWLSFWRDVMLRSSGSESIIVNLDWESQIEALSKRIGMAEARKLCFSFEQGLDKLERYINARLLMEVLLLELPSLN